MKQFLSLALPLWKISASHVYERADLEMQIDQLVATEAVGWAVPMEPLFRGIGPEVWFSTDLGSDRVMMGPFSVLAIRSLIQLSLDDNDRMVMKVLKPDTQINGIAEWSVPDGASYWGTSSTLVVGNQAVEQTFDGTIFDFVRRDIEFSPLPMNFFENAWSLDSVQVHNSRLMVPCDELERRRTTGGFSLKLNDVWISIHKVMDVDHEFAGLRLSGWCPVNVILGAIRPTIGRTILEQYDLMLDKSNNRMIVVPKSSLTPERPLMKYRLDRGFPTESTSGSWRWIPSPGRIYQDDFVFGGMDADSARFKIICLVKECANHLLPSERTLWVGAPNIEIDALGAVTVHEKRGWEGYAIELSWALQTVTIRITRKGYRMKRDPETNVPGMSMELVPVEGPKELGEFLIPDWPPVFGGPFVEIAHISSVDSEALIGDNHVWHGMPQFEVSLDNRRILVTAEVSEDTCYRRVSCMATFPAGETFLDFGTEVCNYRQVDAGEQGYRFKRTRRSEFNSADALKIEVKQGAVDFDRYREIYLSSMSLPDNVWSPNMRWMAAPRLTVDPESRDILIRPTGERGWEYKHEWERGTESGASRLIFKVLPRKLLVPQGLQLIYGLWEFRLATADEEGFRFTIVKDRWRREGQDGVTILLFEEIEGPIFQGATRGLYTGIPDISFDEGGNLVVRSNGDQRFHFEVQALESGPSSLEIVFTPVNFAAAGSVPVEAKPEDDRCTICYDDYSPGEQLAETRCKHRFHLSCLMRVVGRKCPLCRTSLDLI